MLFDGFEQSHPLVAKEHAHVGTDFEVTGQAWRGTTGFHGKAVRLKNNASYSRRHSVFALQPTRRPR